MQAGRLTENVTILSKSFESRGLFGEVTRKEPKERQVRASVTHTGGTLEENAGELFASVTCKVEMHAYQKVLAGDRLRIRGDEYDVLSVDRKPSLRRLTIIARRVNR